MPLLTLPGLIDPHVHLRDPGETHKEDFYTGTAAALAGGYTTILDMPNNKFPITTETALEEKIESAKKKIVCNVGFHFGTLGNNLDEFEGIQNKVMGLKIYLNETTGNYLLKPQILEKIFEAWPQKLPILVHAEEEMITKVIEVQRIIKRRVHVCHVSSKNELEAVMKAKKHNLPMTCGVTPHHLFLTETDAKRLKGYGSMKPPLKTQQDLDFLWKHINAIDCIESDHAPHTKKDKLGRHKAFGVPGLETTLPLMLTAVADGLLSMEKLIELCHENPAQIFYVSTNFDTRVEVDPNASYDIDAKQFHSKAKWSPFEGMKVKGRVVRVFIGGKKVFEKGKVLAEPGSGQIITHTL